MIPDPAALILAGSAISAVPPLGRLLSTLRPRRPDIAAAAALLASTPLYHLDPALIGTPPRAIVTRA
ncbi:hypothetical protein [Sphingomonas sp. Leaf25]|uniref:hypothetical protein n=1 Tax=Sphingomonas sp. Leaf25 TaxID=1735692 RepID=UPI0006F49385|nr:hypothetical protein [Sphingomonas sp. Leaf25]KQN00582.1 hypothetical protein ASE78_05715 [Sphingomonas sp. Leaf25]